MDEVSLAAPVSVLIPCYNGERFLGETLESVLTQTMPPSQVVVVDDASTDGSRRVADSFGPRVTVLSSPGHGVSAARNHATAAATEEFIQYVDADDLLDEHALESRLEAIARSDADIAISDWRRLHERDGEWCTGKIESGCLPGAGERADVSVLKGFWAPLVAILYRREVCDRIGGWRETLPIVQDARFLLDAFRLGARVVHVQNVGALYRQHASNSVSTRSVSEFWWDVLRNGREVEAAWERDGRLDELQQSALADMYGNCLRVGLDRDESLFLAALGDVRRFPELASSRLVRAALLVSRGVGERGAAWCLKKLRV